MFQGKMSAGENAVLRQLQKCWKQTFLLIEGWKTTVCKTEHFVKVINQLDQRESVEKSDLSDTPLGKLPDFKERLTATIDLEITNICSQIDEDIERLEVTSLKMKELYSSCGQLLERYGEELDAATLTTGAETRPSISQLFSWLDEVVLHYQRQSAAFRTIFSTFSPTRRDGIVQLLRIWTPVVTWELRLDRTIRPPVSAFINNCDL